MAYNYNKNFKPGEVLKSADLKTMEEAIINAEANIGTLQHNVANLQNASSGTQGDWDETNTASSSYIKNKPFTSIPRTVTYDGNIDNALPFTSGMYATPFCQGESLRKENFIGAEVTVTMTMNGETQSMSGTVEKMCKTLFEIEQYIASTQIHVILAEGTLMNLPSHVTLCLAAGPLMEGVNTALPLFAIIPSELFMGEAGTIPAGLYMVYGSEDEGMYYYTSKVQWNDIQLSEAYANFFNTNENNIKVVSIESEEDILEVLDFSLYKPGDIIFAVMGMDALGLNL